MGRSVEVAIGLQHGETCTCKRLDPITVTAQPVIVNRDCPGQHETPHRTRIAGNVTITWPRPSAGAIAAVGSVVADADTGTVWSDVIDVRVDAGPKGIVTADIERLVDENGAPDPAGRGRAVPTEDGTRWRTAVFRYAVAEMRIADPT